MIFKRQSKFETPHRHLMKSSKQKKNKKNIYKHIQEKIDTSFSSDFGMI